MAKGKTYTAAEVAEFMNYNTFWKKDWYYDDDGYLENFLKTPAKSGYVAIDPTAKIAHSSLYGIPVLWQGKGKDPTDGEGYNLAVLVSNYLRDKTSVVLTIEIPKERAEEFKIVLREEYNGKVL